MRDAACLESFFALFEYGMPFLCKVGAFRRIAMISVMVITAFVTFSR